MTFPVPDATLANHIAVLGKTGSGKTSTSKLIVEHEVEQGFRVCILDPIKSDWWGITSSAGGKAPGLPFRILGGPHGHVPLHSSSGKVLGQIVGEGKLPLSIIDMADFEIGGPQRFFVDFAAALMRHTRGVLYLVVEEAHEFAPKERAGFGAENMAIHWAKKLATAGRSKGIRLIVATQRVQSLHNAVLGSCETLIAHRLTTPADQKPVVDWLKANVPDKETQTAIANGLSSLPNGTGWLCSGEARVFEQIPFPKFATYDNTATPTADTAELTVKTAPVDQDELQTLIGEAVEEAKANDPKLLKIEIGRLARELAAASKGGAPAWPDQRKLVTLLEAEAATAEDRGYQRGLTVGISVGITRCRTAIDALRVPDIIDQIPAASAGETRPPVPAGKSKQEPPRPTPPRAARPAPASVGEAPPRPMGGASLSGPQAQLLRAIAWWHAMGHDAPSRAQAAAIAGWRITSGHLKNVAGACKTAGWVDYPSTGTLALTDAGKAVAPAPDLSQSFHDSLRGILTGPQRLVFDHLLANGPADTRDGICAALRWEATSGHIKNVVGLMKTLELVEYPKPGEVRLQQWVIGAAPKGADNG